MASENKKLALLRILEILQENTDCDHMLTHSEIAEKLLSEYGIEIERKAVGRNISLLLEADYDIVTTKRGVYLNERKYEPSEIRLLIDGVLSSRHVSLRHSRDLIEKLANEENKYFRKNIKHIYSVNDFNKSDNTEVFYSIDIVHEAIEKGKMVEYNYNKYDADKKLHKTSFQRISPFQLIFITFEFVRDHICDGAFGRGIENGKYLKMLLHLQDCVSAWKEENNKHI